MYQSLSLNCLSLVTYAKSVKKNYPVMNVDVFTVNVSNGVSLPKMSYPYVIINV